MAGTMQAIVVDEFGSPEVLKVKEVPVPQPGEGQALVKIFGAGVNPVETYIRAGTYANLPPLPWTPGTDGAGVVEAVGENYPESGPKVGDRVWLLGADTGTYAQYALCKASSLHPLPEAVSFDKGGAVAIAYRTAWRALHMKARVRPGQSLLVHGASGAVGLAAVQIAKAFGMAPIIGTASSAEGRELARQAGCDVALDHRDPAHFEELENIDGLKRRKLGPTVKGVDVIVEFLANANLGSDLKRLAPGGVVVVVGSRGPTQVDARDLMLCEGSVVGLLGPWDPEELEEAAAGITAGLRNGSLDPVVGQQYGLEEAPKTHVDVIEQAGGSKGKLVLLPWGKP